MLAKSLLKRMRLDLTTLVEDDDPGTHLEGGSDEDVIPEASTLPSRSWIALPRALRLSTRPRPPLNPDGSRPRLFNRISKSGSMPSFISNLTVSIDSLAERLVEEALMPLFRKLHPEKSGWNLSLVNVCATSMSLTASDGGKGAGRDIGKMFSKQEDKLKEWKIDDVDVAPSDHSDQEEDIQEDVEPRECDPTHTPSGDHTLNGSEDLPPLTQSSTNDDDTWDNEDDIHNQGDVCKVCGAVMPSYAMVAHERFHAMPD